MDNIDQLVSCLRMRIVSWLAWIDNVLTNVILDHFGNEAVQRAAARRRLLQHPNTFNLGFHRALNGINLAAQPFKPVEKFCFFFSQMAHDFPY